ncbi:MAG: hypothetical protein HQ534_05230 [Armatimonadetes bacterium]|nr:hypothetical protein [Armatimonadota bacterium]
MNKEKLIKEARNPKYISGIYNYCDRWCERCQFTASCLNYKIGQENYSDLEKHDISSAEFWEGFSNLMKDTIDMIKDMALEHGIGLDSIETVEKETSSENVIHLTSEMAYKYITLVDDWFDSCKYVYEDSEIYQRLNHSKEAAVKFDDIIQIIRWYQMQIYVKLQRALDGEMDEDNDFSEDFPNDSDGSAKVALIGIDRSIGSWTKMLDFFPDRKEKLIKIISFLNRLCSIVERKFPKAREFVRPGFDQIDDAN